MRLEQLVEFTSGELISRLQERGTIDDAPGDYELFAADSGTRRYLHTTAVLTPVAAGQLILGLTQQYIFIREQATPPLLLTANFAAITVGNQVDAQFLAWWFNESDEAQRQKYQIAQSASTVLTRLTLQDVKKMHITLPTAKRQGLIGRLYANELAQVALLRQREALIAQRATGVIQRIWRGTDGIK